MTENEYIVEQLFKELKKVAKQDKELIKEFIEKNPLLLEYYDKEFLINI